MSPLEILIIDVTFVWTRIINKNNAFCTLFSNDSVLNRTAQNRDVADEKTLRVCSVEIFQYTRTQNLRDVSEQVSRTLRNV